MTADHSFSSEVETTSGDGKQAIVEDIERTREQLGETVEALAAKADVKAQAKQKATEVQAQAKQKATEVAGTARRQAGRALAVVGEHRQQVAVTAAAGAALLAGILVIRKLRR